jgi:hypothetical protein
VSLQEATPRTGDDIVQSLKEILSFYKKEELNLPYQFLRDINSGRTYKKI